MSNFQLVNIGLEDAPDSVSDETMLVHFWRIFSSRPQCVIIMMSEYLETYSGTWHAISLQGKLLRRNRYNGQSCTQDLSNWYMAPAHNSAYVFCVLGDLFDYKILWIWYICVMLIYICMHVCMYAYIYMYIYERTSSTIYGAKQCTCSSLNISLCTAALSHVVYYV